METRQEYNKRVFGIIHPTWVTNSQNDPSTNQIFHQGYPQGTRQMSENKIRGQGLWGWYRAVQEDRAMVQKWYNRILWTSGLTAMGGILIVLPIMMLFEMGAILNTIAIFIPVSGIIFVSFIFGDIFFGCRHFSAWVNHRYDKPLDRSG